MDGGTLKAAGEIDAGAPVGSFDLYVEDRAGATPLLLIPPAGGDAGLFAHLIDRLVPSYRCVTFDRRGNSRSGPSGMRATTAAAQVEDAVAVLDDRRIDRAIVFGTSAGGSIALEMARRHPSRVELLILHEPSLLRTLPGGDGVIAELKKRIALDRGRDGDTAAFERFLNFAFGEPTWSRIATEPVGERVLANASLFLDVELDPLSTVVPPIEERLGVKAVVLCGDVGPDFLRPLCEAVATGLGAAVHDAPGGHGGYFDHPTRFSETLKHIIEEAA